jgi:hypothetical protein
MSRGGSVSQSVANSATNDSSGEVSQLSQSQPDEFPAGVLPLRVLGFVVEAAEALGVDPALIAGPCLATIAGCLGNRRKIIVKSGAWTEPAILWVAIVQPSGAKKTPAIKVVLAHLERREARVIALYEKQRERRAGCEPQILQPNRLLVSDITAEALLATHAMAPLGLILHRDELGGWLSSFNQYKAGGKGGDAQTWTEMHQGGLALIDRKTGGTFSVPRAAVSIVGGVQPEPLRIALSGEHKFDGIASRILFVAPPESVNKWSEATICIETWAGWNDLLDELLALQPDKDGNPIDLPMTAEAKEVWIEFYNQHGMRQEAEGDGPMKSAMAKQEAAAARLALAVQLANDPQSKEVSVDAMRAGIILSGWFEGQARRVYSSFKESAKDRERRAVYNWIAGNGRSTTMRDFARLGPGRFRKRAQELLNDLAYSGRRRPPVPAARRPLIPTEGDHPFQSERDHF